MHKIRIAKIRADINVIFAIENRKLNADFIVAFNESITLIDDYFYSDELAENEAKELYEYSRLIYQRYTEIQE